MPEAWTPENIRHLQERCAQLSHELTVAQASARVAVSRAVATARHFGVTPEQMEAMLGGHSDHHIHIHFPDPIRIQTDGCQTTMGGALRQIENIVTHNAADLKKLMATQTEIKAALDDVLRDVKENTTQIQSLDVLVQGLADQLAAALKEAGASDAVLAAAKAVTDAISEQKTAIVAAVNINTPDETPADVEAAKHL